ncbi:hypothetical protein GCM10027299_30090 [Larkinella ripae]
MTENGSQATTHQPKNRGAISEAKDGVKTGYFAVNGLNLYYEIHGSGQPLVLLHGGVCNIEITFGAVLPTLARSWQVIAIEQQGHGHTADIDRPMSFPQMADDTAALLRHLGIDRRIFSDTVTAGMWAWAWPSGIPNGCGSWWLSAPITTTRGWHPRCWKVLKPSTPTILISGG